MFSINTNAGAFTALRALSAITAELGVVQQRLATGLKVSSTKDDSATYAMAQNLRARQSGLRAVAGSLDRAMGVLDVSVVAAETVSDLLIQMREKAIAASDAGLDAPSRAALDRDFAGLRDQIKSVIASAGFNGTNILDGGSDSLGALMSETDRLTMANQDLALGGSVIGVADGAGFTSAAEAAAMVATIDQSRDRLSDVLSSLGSAYRRVEGQKKFNARLSDTIETGIGNLVDADMAREATRLQALQVRQQLAIQALAIANRQPQLILQLFQ